MAGLPEAQEEGEDEPDKLKHQHCSPLEDVGRDVTKYSETLPLWSELCVCVCVCSRQQYILTSGATYLTDRVFYLGRDEFCERHHEIRDGKPLKDTWYSPVTEREPCGRRGGGVSEP